jgi:hypothetical protein
LAAILSGAGTALKDQMTPLPNAACRRDGDPLIATSWIGEISFHTVSRSTDAVPFANVFFRHVVRLRASALPPSARENSRSVRDQMGMRRLCPILCPPSYQLQRARMALTRAKCRQLNCVAQLSNVWLIPAKLLILRVRRIRRQMLYPAELRARPLTLPKLLAITPVFRASAGEFADVSQVPSILFRWRPLIGNRRMGPPRHAEAPSWSHPTYASGHSSSNWPRKRRCELRSAPGLAEWTK